MKSILLIEDTAEIIENLTEYLEIKSCKIFSATNGQRGIEIARDVKPGLIVCDALMPEMNGHEVLRLLLDDAKPLKYPLSSAPQCQR